MGRIGQRIYNNPRWARVRVLALRRAQWFCEGCGRISAQLEVDHIVPLYKGGRPFDLDNVQVLCRRPCHQEKTANENRKPTPGKKQWVDYLKELRP